MPNDFDTQIQSDELASIHHLDDEFEEDEFEDNKYNDDDSDCYCE